MTVTNHLSRSRAERTPYSGFSVDKDEIRAIQLLAGQFEEELVAELILVCLTKASPSTEYEALSYTWGRRARDGTMTLNGMSGFALTDNAFNALRRLRYTNRSRILWVDAICIDQSNVDERGRQVQLMDKIYNQASEVLVWLGDADVRKVSWKHRMLSSIPFRNSFREDEEQCLLMALLEDKPSWCDRVWVVQEFLLAKKEPIACFGPHTIPWKRLRSKLKAYFEWRHPHEEQVFWIGNNSTGTYSNGSMRGLLQQLWLQKRPGWIGYAEMALSAVYMIMWTVINAVLVMESAYETPSAAGYSNELRLAFETKLDALSYQADAMELYRDPDPRSSLLDIAYELRDLAATDPRDRVYALLSLANAEVKAALKPRYDIPVTATFAIATYTVFTEGDRCDFDVLSLVTFGTERPNLAPWKRSKKQERTEGLPTWAIDFAFPDAYSAGVDTWTSLRPVQQSKPSPGRSVSISTDCSSITISRAYAIGRVRKVIPIPVFLPEDTKPDFAMKKSNFMDGALSLLNDVVSTCSYCSIFTRGPFTASPNIATPVTRNTFEGAWLPTEDLIVARLFELWDIRVWPEKAAEHSYQVDDTAQRRTAYDQQQSYHETKSWNPRRRPHAIYRAVTRAQHSSGGAAIFATDTGFLGICNRYVRPGDAITMLNEEPHIIATRSLNADVHEFCGLVFVHGLMRDELDVLRDLGYALGHGDVQITLK